MDKKIIVFKDKDIRRIFYNNEWFFSVVDVVRVLTDSLNPRNYWNMLKARELENNVELYTNCVQLKIKSTDGKRYLTDCASKEGVFRIIQSIPSKKAEPFKMWLAKVGSDRIDEIENPELAQERMKELYEKKGYSKSWIDKRIRGIAVRQDLTDEWKSRGVEQGRDFAILTAEIANATFGMTPNEYKKFKGLGGENLRDHIGRSADPKLRSSGATDLELIFSMLGEASTAEIERTQDPESFEEHRTASVKGGTIARNAREELEEETGERVISGENYLYKREIDVITPLGVSKLSEFESKKNKGLNKK